METYEIGEVAIYINPGSPIHKEEVEIIEGLRERLWRDEVTHVYGMSSMYGIRSNIGRMCADATYLRKKKRKKEKTTTWEHVEQTTGWQPKEEINHGR